MEKRLRENSGGAPYALGTSSYTLGTPAAVTTTGRSVVACARTEWVATANIEAANAISGRSRGDKTPQKNWIFLMNAAHRYKIVMIGKIIFEEKQPVRYPRL